MIKATKREIKKNFAVFTVSSGDELDKLLPETANTYYTCGVYGWNASYRKLPGYNMYLLEYGYRELIGIPVPPMIINKIIAYRKKAKNKEKIFKFIENELHKLLTEKK